MPEGEHGQIQEQPTRKLLNPGEEAVITSRNVLKINAGPHTRFRITRTQDGCQITHEIRPISIDEEGKLRKPVEKWQQLATGEVRNEASSLIGRLEPARERRASWVQHVFDENLIAKQDPSLSRGQISVLFEKDRLVIQNHGKHYQIEIFEISDVQNIRSLLDGTDAQVGEQRQGLLEKITKWLRRK